MPSVEHVATPPNTSGVTSGAPHDARGATRRAPFVLAIEVDQLSAWVAATRLAELPEDGGFARLRREGTWVKNLRFAHSVTDTAPGHAALHTGATPNESGVFGNERVERGAKSSALKDPGTFLVTSEGRTSTVGSSAAVLRVDTVADRLRAAHPDALVVSFSLKDRGAILPAGKRPSHVAWFDPRFGQFVTSTAFADALPPWVVALGGAEAVANARQKPWTLDDPAWTASHAAEPDDAPGEGDLDGLGTTFPHRATTHYAFRALPASDAMLFDLALAAVDAAYDPSKPTLVLLSLSASDVVGHTFGPDSWEAWDHLRKLDRTLGDALAKLESKVGPVTVLLAADHGNVSMPESDAARAKLAHCKDPTHPAPDPWDRPCRAGTRIGQSSTHAALKAAEKRAFGRSDLIDGFADPYVFLTETGRALEGAARAKLDGVVRSVFLGQGGAIAEIFDARRLAAECPEVLRTARPVPERARGREDVRTLVCRSWSPGIGDAYVVTRPGSFFDGEIVVGKGASHGTPYLYDRTVPMLVRARGDVDEGRVVDDPVDFTAFAALEAHFLGLDARPARTILDERTAR